MGTSGAMGTSNQYVKYSISIGTNWQSLGENYSSVNVQVRFWRTNSGYSTYGSGTVYCKINGTTYSASVSSSQKITNSGITLFNRDVAVGHNADGSKYLDTSAWININAPLSSSEQWYGEWLNTIPRASSISGISGGTLGSSVTVNINRASNSFKHTVIYQRSDGKQFTVGENIDTSCTFTPSINDSGLLPNSTQGTAKMIVNTNEGGTYIGSSSRDFTVYVPSNIVPTINSITLSETVSGISSKFGGYVQSKSKIKGVVSASGAYSSTINKYQSNTNSQTFTSPNFTTNELINSGNQSVNTTVTDSRGRTASKTANYTVIPYSNPTITTFTVTRANSSGQIDDRGSYVLCTINSSISSVNDKNDKSFILKWSANGETTRTVSLTPSSGYNLNTTYLASNINVDKEYTFTLEVKDYFTTTSQTKPIPTAFTLVDYNASGKSISFGGVSTANANETKMQIKMDVDLEGNFKINNQTIFDLIYPIGAIYMSVNSVNPQNLFGGTWISWGNGRVPVGVNTNDGDFNYPEKTGGGKNHRHYFRIGMHWYYGSAAGEGRGNGTGAYRYSDGQYDGWARDLAYQGVSLNSNTATGTRAADANGKWSLGDTDLSTQLQPYITCYMWKRTG